MLSKNQATIDDFLGLSSSQVHHLLNNGDNPSDFYVISEALSTQPSAPVLYLVDAIAEAVEATQGKGLKATATGKLPQKLCQSVFLEYRKPWLGTMIYNFAKVHKEDDFLALQVARLLMQITGLLRKTKGQFHLTQKYKKLSAKDGNKRIFSVLFKAYCFEFNWAYCDRYSDMPFVQQSALFSLYMLSAMGHVKQAESVYADTFLQAFPIASREVEFENQYISADKETGHCYTLRVTHRFCWFMGLVSVELPEGQNGLRSDKLIKKLPLFDELMTFKPLS